MNITKEIGFQVSKEKKKEKKETRFVLKRVSHESKKERNAISGLSVSYYTVSLHGQGRCSFL